MGGYRAVAEPVTERAPFRPAEGWAALVAPLAAAFAAAFRFSPRPEPDAVAPFAAALPFAVRRKPVAPPEPRTPVPLRPAVIPPTRPFTELTTPFAVPRTPLTAPSRPIPPIPPLPIVGELPTGVEGARTPLPATVAIAP